MCFVCGYNTSRSRCKDKTLITCLHLFSLPLVPKLPLNGLTTMYYVLVQDNIFTIVLNIIILSRLSKHSTSDKRLFNSTKRHLSHGRDWFGNSCNFSRNFSQDLRSAQYMIINLSLLFCILT